MKKKAFITAVQLFFPSKNGKRDDGSADENTEPSMIIAGVLCSRSETLPVQRRTRNPVCEITRGHNITAL